MSRHLFLAVLFILFQIGMRAGDAEIPEKIKKSFELKFPNASEVKWERVTANQFEVGFVNNGKENLAILNSDGSIAEIETELQPSELPKRIISAIKKKFPYAGINYATKVYRNNTIVAYELELKNGSEEFDITLSPLGFEME